MNGMTIDEIAEALKISSNAAYKRLERAGIKPVSHKALYDPSVVDKIRNTSKGGRPKKPAPEAPKKPRKTSITGS